MSLNRLLGKTGIELPAIGLGCMGLSEFYGPATEKSAAIDPLHRAIDLGVRHFDTAELYGNTANEVLLGEAFHGRRDEVFVATKFGPVRDPETGEMLGLDGSRKNCRRAIEGSLKRLQTDVVDLYYLHRVDPATPIEETMTAMAELVAEGKVRHLGLSEASGDTIRRAAAIHPISAVQSEYSIFTRDIEDQVIPACRDVGASLVAYSPLGRGMLSGKFKLDAPPDDQDYRSTSPRFQGEAFEANLALVQEIESVAAALSVPSSQVALAWLLAQGEHVLAIPGTTRLSNLQSNLAAADVVLDNQQLRVLDRLADQVKGNRYDERGMSIING